MLNTDDSAIVSHAIIGQELIKAKEQRGTHSSLKVDLTIKGSDYVFFLRLRQLECFDFGW